MHFATPFWVGA